MASFRVDEVERARDPMPTRRLADLLADALAIGGAPACVVVDHGRTHALLGAVHLAFAEHRPLVLSPDAIWLTIAQGVAQHVRLNAEALRSRLVRHAATKRISLEWDGPMPTDPVAWTQIVERFRGAIADEVGDGRARLLECDFSTTTDFERVASRVVMMDVYAPYFDYHLMCICGIPEITLLGTVDDRRTIRARVDVIAELDLAVWARNLAPIADQFVRAASGDADVAFWKRIYKPRDAYGGPVITGWISRLYPYLEEGGRIRPPNPMLDLALDGPRGHDGRTGESAGPGITSGRVAVGPSTAHVVVRGIAGERRLASPTPACSRSRRTRTVGWPRSVAGRFATAVRRWSMSSIGSAPITSRHPRRSATGASSRGSWGLPRSAALNDLLDGAVLFAGAGEWRAAVRGPGEHRGRGLRDQELLDQAAGRSAGWHVPRRRRGPPHRLRPWPQRGDRTDACGGRGRPAGRPL